MTMAISLLLLSLLTFPISILAEPAVVGLDFEKREVFGNEQPALRRRATDDVPIYNAQGSLLYLINVTVGSPPQRFQLQLDTGSSDIWIPWAGSSQCSRTRNRCVDGGSFDDSSSSSFRTLQSSSFLISYVDGTRIRGDYITDTFTIGTASVPDMIMGLAKTATENDNVSNFQGIIGIGFETGEAVYAQSGQTYKNIVTRLKESGATRTRAYSLWLNDKDNGKGSILFGGIDTEKFKAPLTALPIQPDARSNTVTSFTVALDNFNVIGADNSNQYSRKDLAMPVILDSGTTLTYLPDRIANDLYTGVGAVVSSTYGVVVPCDLANSPATFNFGFGNANGPVIVAPISQFVLQFPPGFPTPTFRASGKSACRWGIQAAGTRPILFGDTFLRNAYVVYNLDNNEIAIAEAVLNATKSNIQEISGSSIPGVSVTATGAVARQTASGLQGPNTLGFGNGGGSMSIGTASGTFNLGTGAARPSSGGGNRPPNAASHSEIPIIISAVMALGGVAFMLL